MGRHTDDSTGIIAVTDPGRSTGTVRVAVDVPAPGDIRSALVMLAEGDAVLLRLVNHHFGSFLRAVDLPRPQRPRLQAVR